ncbi:hypothetical protein ACFE04_016904 [Oxalis oulophora]
MEDTVTLQSCLMLMDSKFMEWIGLIEADNPRLPCFCFGHSTGASIILKVIAPLIAFLIPRYRISGAQKGMPVSRDPEENLKRVKVPFLFLHGTTDIVTDPAASQKLYEEASSSDKTLKLFEGFLHDLLFETERKDIANHIIQWYTRRLQWS